MKLVFHLSEQETRSCQPVWEAERPQRPARVSVSNKRQTTLKIDDNMLTFKFYPENKLIMFLSSLFVYLPKERVLLLLRRSCFGFTRMGSCSIEVSDKKWVTQFLNIFRFVQSCKVATVVNNWYFRSTRNACSSAIHSVKQTNL